MKFQFKCGQTVKDTITGYEGVVVARTQWLNNCNTYRVQARELKDGKPIDSAGFDEPQLVLIKDKKKIEAKQATGGPDRPIGERSY